MPRLNVNTLRWLLLGANLLALGGLIALGWNLVGGSGDQLRASLPEPGKFVVSPDLQQTIDSAQLNSLIRIHKTLPPEVAKPKPPEPEDLEVHQGGPLDQWEIASTTIDPAGRKYLTLEQKVETSAVRANPIQTRRPAARMEGRALCLQEYGNEDPPSHHGCPLSVPAVVSYLKGLIPFCIAWVPLYRYYALFRPPRPALTPAGRCGPSTTS